MLSTNIFRKLLQTIPSIKVDLQNKMEKLYGCDTFVVMGDVSETGEVVFGKNSDRPNGEVQEVVYFPEKDHGPGETLKCTYIEIEQAKKTLATVLSKPAWMWGAEMGSNSAGVVIGNEAVWDRLSDDENDLVPRLLGMDLLRLGLERSVSASEALDVITNLLEKHGQGGQCSDILENFSYHNTFLIADPTEAWVLETADRLWAAERVVTGCRNISNCMSITTKIDKCSSGLEKTAKERGWWDGKKQLNWSQIIGGSTGELANPSSRWSCGGKLLEEKSNGGKFNVADMMKVLRDEDSGINMSGGSFPTTGSQVSVLSKCEEVGSCHWFTATQGPSLSVFKPFIFSGSSSTGDLTVSPAGASLAPKQREHPLWAAHSKRKWASYSPWIEGIEKKFLSLGEKERRKKDRQSLFCSAAEEEMELYKSKA